MYENKGFLSNVVGDFKKQKIFFVCVVCLFFFLHKNKYERLRLLCPHSECVTVTAPESESGCLWILSDLALILLKPLKTLYTE